MLNLQIKFDMRCLVLFFVLLQLCSCEKEEKLNLNLILPEECKTSSCEYEFYLEDKGKVIFSSSFEPGEKFYLPEKVLTDQSILHLFAKTGNSIYSAVGSVDKYKTFLFVPSNGSRKIKKLNYPRYAHSQIFHPSGYVVIIGGLRRLHELKATKEYFFERHVELYNIYTNELSVFPVQLSVGRAYHQSQIMQDGRIFISTGDRYSQAEIIDLDRQTVERLPFKGKNFFYLGGEVVYYETPHLSKIKNFQTGKEYFSEPLKFNEQKSYPLRMQDKLFLLNNYSSYIDMASMIEFNMPSFPFGVGLFSHAVNENGIYFIDRNKHSNIVFSIFPGNLEPVSIELLRRSSKGEDIECLDDLVIFTGNFFNVCSADSKECVSLNVLEKRAFHKTSRIDHNRFFISGGLDKYKNIISSIEMFFLNMEDSL